MKQNWNFLGGSGVGAKQKTFCGGGGGGVVWIFPATAQCYIFQTNSENVNITNRVLLFNIFVTQKALVNYG